MRLFADPRAAIPRGSQRTTSPQQRSALQRRVVADDRAPAAFATEPVVAKRPYSYQPIKSQSQQSYLENAYDIGSLFINKLWPVELARMSISSTNREPKYARYLNPTQLKMRERGYVLFINPEIAGDLNEFGKRHNEKRLTGAEIQKLAREFDRQFTPDGDLAQYGSGIFANLVRIEFNVDPNVVFEASKATMFTTRPVGGMKGGGYNAKTGKPTGAYWGITQFGAGTYLDVIRHARGYGVTLPKTRSEMTFGQMLVAAYILAIIRQPTLINVGVPVVPATIYINHNQGNGVWLQSGTKFIKALAWDGQSKEVKELLSSYGFVRV